MYRLQAKGLGKFAAAKIAKNIRLLTTLIKEFEAYDIKSILDELPPELKPEKMQEGFWANIDRQHTVKQSEKPSRREELKHTTSFGLLTRSKNEALIAELLHAAGIEFDCNFGWAKRGVLRYGNQRNHRSPSGSDDRKQILAPFRSHGPRTLPCFLHHICGIIQ